mmetsp:Transcript_15974/g.17737  ORF Transcript_15974/g.17737 Transcript_15974/m.17737 type:complete len:321 (-) Transcript_15974:99-1061(-)
MSLQTQYLALTLIAFCCITVCVGESVCHTYKSCGDCQQHNKNASVGAETCGWCAGVQGCFPGDASGSAPIPVDNTNFTCSPRDWFFEECNHCETLQGCAACTKYQDCQWCPQLVSCGHIGAQTCPAPVTECECSHLSTCGDCSDQRDCEWCRTDPTKDGFQCYDTKNVTDEECFPSCECSMYSKDRACTACKADTRCFFCNDGGNLICTEDTNTNCTLAVITCPEVCTDRKSCEACTGVPNTQCFWCDDETSHCANSESLCFNPVGDWTMCPAPFVKSKSCAGYFVGGMFLPICLIIIAVILIFVFLRLKGKRLNYSVVS